MHVLKIYPLGPASANKTTSSNATEADDAGFSGQFQKAILGPNQPWNGQANVLEWPSGACERVAGVGSLPAELGVESRLQGEGRARGGGVVGKAIGLRWVVLQGRGRVSL